MSLAARPRFETLRRARWRRCRRVAPDAHPEFFDRAGAAWLPIGSFVLTIDDRVLLVDAGLGPTVQPMQGGMSLIGGQLLTNRGDRLLLLGDAITGPIQLDEPSWHSFGDVHPDLAERTRERLWAELSDGATLGVGAHFPNLRPGYVTSPPARRRVVPGSYRDLCELRRSITLIGSGRAARLAVSNGGLNIKSGCCRPP